ncbi:MAG: hypothetical protein LLF97_03220 [Planctomycetaceae bacterium]|nr:hypothetical protein [Planctomycetaceae bacterium]
MIVIIFEIFASTIFDKETKIFLPTKNSSATRTCFSFCAVIRHSSRGVFLEPKTLRGKMESIARLVAPLLDESSRDCENVVLVVEDTQSQRDLCEAAVDDFFEEDRDVSAPGAPTDAGV